MLTLSIYKPFMPKESAFLDGLDINEQEYGEEFLDSLASCEMFSLYVIFGVALFTCISYYTWYNNIVKPWGYHYRKRHWFVWMIISMVLMSVGTYIIENRCLVNIDLPGTSEFIFMLYVVNLLFIVLVYFFLSMIWCNCLPTNAYRWFNWFNRK